MPWRFFDAGQLSLRSVSSLPASKNQHMTGLMQRNRRAYRTPRLPQGKQAAADVARVFNQGGAQAAMTRSQIALSLR